ncbi:MAG: SRPBCC family protein, partial [Acidobacteriota bacterium]
MIKKLLLGVLGFALMLVVVGFFLPRQVHLERSIEIDAPQHTVFALVNGFPRFNEWSPWAGIDPETVYEYEGPSHGVGAGMSWRSDNPDVGSGSQKIQVSDAPNRVEASLDFGEQGLADSFFQLEPAGDAVKVTWGFDSDMGMNPLGR